jgi:RimJ/RimL family protein N-acetyltransferase
MGDVRSVEIVPITEDHIEGFHSCLDEVARERRYLGMTKAPPESSVRQFVMENIIRQNPQFVALDGERVVGWIDITIPTLEGFEHTGRLGMGMLRPYRGQGIGKRLLDRALDAARARGVERVELEVYALNTPAVRLYEKAGFVAEGTKRRARKLEGEYEDMIFMALFL